MTYPDPLPLNASYAEEMAWDHDYMMAESKRVARERPDPLEEAEFRPFPTILDVWEDGTLRDPRYPNEVVL